MSKAKQPNARILIAEAAVIRAADFADSLDIASEIRRDWKAGDVVSIAAIIEKHLAPLRKSCAAGWAWAEKLSLHLYELVEIESDAAATLRNYESAKDARDWYDPQKASSNASL